MKNKYTIVPYLVIAVMVLSMVQLSEAGQQSNLFIDPGNDQEINSDGVNELLSSLTITFEEYASGTNPTILYQGVVFSQGYTIWSTSSTIYPPYNGSANNAYTHEINNWINFTDSVGYFSAYYSTGFDYSIQVFAFDSNGNEMAYDTIVANAKNQLIEFDLKENVIDHIQLKGISGFSSQWTVDQITFGSYEEPHVITNTITFEEYPGGTAPSDLYEDVIFSSGYTIWTTTSTTFPPYGGSSSNVYTHEVNNWINFTESMTYFSAYYSSSSYSLTVSAFASNGTIVATGDVPAGATNQYIEFKLTNGNIDHIQVSGPANFETTWTMDHMTFGFDSTYGFYYFMDFEGISGVVGTQYPGVTYSPGYYVWYTDSLTYPPYQNSSANAYTHEINNFILFDSDLAFYSAYYSTAYSESITVSAYDRVGNFITSQLIEPEAKNQHILFDLGYRAIAEIRLSGNLGFETSWTVDHIHISDIDLDPIAPYESWEHNVDIQMPSFEAMVSSNIPIVITTNKVLNYSVSVDGLEYLVGTSDDVTLSLDYVNNVGQYLLSVYLIIADGSTAYYESYIIVEDTTQPVLNLEYPSSYEEGSTGNTLIFEIYDANPDWINFTIYSNGEFHSFLYTQEWTASDTNSISIDGLSEGIYEIHLQLIDLYGNTLYEVITLEVYASAIITTETSDTSEHSDPVSSEDSETSTDTSSDTTDNTDTTPELALPISFLSVIVSFGLTGILTIYRRRHI